VTEFSWIDWNRQKVAAHALSPEEVEHAWHGRRDVGFGATDPVYGPSLESVGRCPSGRPIRIVWRYNDDWDGERRVFVVTAY
jgi:hypothetical protein